MQLDQLYVDASLHMKMTCEISFTVYDNDKYYEVPAATRWRYGAAYFVLAGVLGGHDVSCPCGRQCKSVRIVYEPPDSSKL
ncbi:hypothetical protein ACFSQ7_30505 [Paenibacillus rhizoplanae]